MNMNMMQMLSMRRASSAFSLMRLRIMTSVLCSYCLMCFLDVTLELDIITSTPTLVAADSFPPPSASTGFINTIGSTRTYAEYTGADGGCAADQTADCFITKLCNQ